jgi:hypothetical protein
MIMTIGNLAFSSVWKKQNLTGYIQYYNVWLKPEMYKRGENNENYVI